MSKQTTCGGCRFWNHDEADTYDVKGPKLEVAEDAAYFSECRRYPPIAGTYSDVNRNFTSMFPMTLDYDWCSEYQPKEES